MCSVWSSGLGETPWTSGGVQAQRMNHAPVIQPGLECESLPNGVIRAIKPFGQVHDRPCIYPDHPECQSSCAVCKNSRGDSSGETDEADLISHFRWVRLAQRKRRPSTVPPSPAPLQSSSILLDDSFSFTPISIQIQGYVHQRSRFVSLRNAQPTSSLCLDNAELVSLTGS